MKHNYKSDEELEGTAGEGLSVCDTCELYEGSLTTDCPGVPSYREHADDVYAGKEDYVEGKGWVNQTSRSSPAYWANLRRGALLL